ncbi:MAG: hypothetical protein HXS46_01375 [Theionarchaea archaeon]|nr:hypothetical protein [Theionarchaea archaeon]
MLSKIRRFIFRKDEELETLAWLISVIDSYRVGMGVDMEGLREKIRSLRGPLRVKNWPQIYKDMEAITDLPLQTEPNIKFYMNLFVFLRFLVKQSFLIIGVILFIFLLTARLPLITTEQLKYILYGIIGVAWLVVVVRWVARDKLRMFYYHHRKDYRKHEERLQKAAQDLINKMGEALTEKEENPRKYTFSVYQKDYNGLEIVRDVGMLRDFYTVTVAKR